MRLLFDTHVLIWALIDTKRIPPHISRLITDGRNVIFVSAANIFEIAARSAAARRHGPPISGERALELATEAGYPLLSLSPEHAAAVETLAPYHSDPFDRLLLAQARVEGLQLLTHDEALAQYDSRTILF